MKIHRKYPLSMAAILMLAVTVFAQLKSKTVLKLV